MVETMSPIRVAAFVAAAATSWVVTGRLRRRGRLRQGDGRKINHIFVLVGGAFCFGWLPEREAVAESAAAGVALMSLVVLVCLFRRRPVLADAFVGNTRESDAPNEATFFWSSWLAGMLALLATQLVLGDVAITRTAALLVGIADGIAEPVGRRIGRHRYAVPSLVRGRACSRSVEGSAAVLIASFATVVGCYWSGHAAEPAPLLVSAAVVAVVLCVVEAISPHGLDDVTILLGSALILRGFTAAGWL
jgi:dolichol kinase